MSAATPDAAAIPGVSPDDDGVDGFAASEPMLHWNEGGTERAARWRSERGSPPPKRVLVVDDTLPADAAYRLACEGTALLWRGDFHNATQILQAMARRVERTPARKQRQRTSAPAAPASPAEAFHQHRLAQSQRARVLASLLLPFDPDYGIPLRRAPDARVACTEAWGPADGRDGPSVASLRQLLGIISAHEWRRKGVAIPALGDPPDNRIHPHYGVFSPVRGEYVSLVASAPLPSTDQTPYIAFDVGAGTGVLAALLARRGVGRVVATEHDRRALECARDNIVRLGVADRVAVVAADLFPDGLASLVVCNPPWLPARASAPIERAVYDEDGRMLWGFLRGLAGHLVPGGEGWLVLSDIAEHLGLRTREELLGAFERNRLKVLDRLDTRPRHPKASDPNDPLHAARAAEITSLWRLGRA